MHLISAYPSDLAITRAARTNGAAFSVADLAALKALTSRPAKLLADGDLWTWYADDATPDDSVGTAFGTVVECTSGPAGRYKRDYEGAVNLKWWASDGSPNDNAAIAAACAISRAIYAPKGIYNTTLVTLTQSVTIYGDGPDHTIFYLRDGSDSDTFYASEVDHLEFRDLTIDGNRANNTNTGDSANPLRTAKCDDVYCENVVFKNGAGNGVRQEGGTKLYFSACSFLDNGANGYYCTQNPGDGTDCIDVWLDGCEADGNGLLAPPTYDGICIDPGTVGARVTNGTSTDNTGTGINVFGNSSAVGADRVIIADNRTSGNGLEGVSVHGSADVTIANHLSYEDGQGGDASRSNGIIIQNDVSGQAQLRRVHLDNVTIIGPDCHGIYIDSVTADAVAEVQIDSPIIANVGSLTADTYDGIYIDKGARVFITNPNIRDADSNMRYAVNTTADSTTVRVHEFNGSQAGVSGAFNMVGDDCFVMYLLGTMRGARVKQSAAQSISDNTETLVTWDQEDFDTQTIHDNSTNPGRLTVPSGVSYVELGVSTEWAGNTNGARVTWINKNASASSGKVAMDDRDAQYEASATLSTGPLAVVAGDYFTVSVFQNTGGALNFGNTTATRFWMKILQ